MQEFFPKIEDCEGRSSYIWVNSIVCSSATNLFTKRNSQTNVTVRELIPGPYVWKSGPNVDAFLMSQLEEMNDGISCSPVRPVPSTAVYPGIVGLLLVCSGVEVHKSTLFNFSTAWSFSAQPTYPCLKTFPRVSRVAMLGGSQDRY